MQLPRKLLLTAVAAACAGCFDWTRDPAGRPDYLVDYIDAHYQDLGQRFVPPVSRAEFAERLRSSRVLFLGDHHRDGRLHEEILALVSWIADAGLRPVLGIEAVGIQDNPELQQYLAGGIEQRELRRRVRARWPASWLDNREVDYPFYRRLLETSRQRRIPVFALEPTPRLHLQARDAKIATNIRRAVQLHHDRLVIVIVGHAHLLGDGHLIGRVGAPSISIGARLSPQLDRLADRHPPIPPTSFLQTERGILFFASARTD